MALSIKDPETERLARALAQRTGETLTVATRRALEERLHHWLRRERAAPLMVIGASAIVAIAFNEPEAESFEHRIADASIRLISAATALEAAMVIETRLGEPGGSELDLWLHKAGVEIVPVDAEQADQARRAWRRFGSGRHPDGLNFGDGFSYALSALTREPLLFKGDDFSKTDIEAA
jgi:ribonuclease VapC